MNYERTSIGNIKHLQVRLEVEEYKALTSEAEKAGMKLQAYVRGLIMHAVRAGAPPAIPAIAEKHVRWHQMLEIVLNDPDERLGIEKNLKWANDSIQAKRATHSAQRRSG